MKILPGLLLMPVLFFGTVAVAAPPSGVRASMELPSLDIRLSNDGTGIIKNATCGHCDHNFVKITPNSKAIVNGVSVDISRARGRAGKDVYIVFDAKTAELQTIYWSE
jgi:hypothetical protein